jgi:preprotein translocase subunit SecD
VNVGDYQCPRIRDPHRTGRVGQKAFGKERRAAQSSIISAGCCSHAM